MLTATAAVMCTVSGAYKYHVVIAYKHLCDFDVCACVCVWLMCVFLYDLVMGSICMHDEILTCIHTHTSTACSIYVKKDCLSSISASRL
jgi:hypothetical protein